MKTKKQLNAIAATVMCLALLITACKKNPAPSSYLQTPETTVTGIKLVANANFGNILTDNNGRSLYFFSNDVSGASNCKDGCIVSWPVFYKENPALGTGLNSSDFAVITRADGSKQNTYKGWPLYYFANDAKAGDTNGDAIDSLWVIARPDYAVMISHAQLTGLDGYQYTSQSIEGAEVSQYITDGYGRTLYTFKGDSASKNKFTKADFSNNGVWPIDTVSFAGVAFPSILDKTQFTTIDVFGKTQLVYKGHPLYFFGQDNATRGNTKGVSFPTPGAAIWKVLNTKTDKL
jgi:predicted lipoprotein with Yx(FWY)xxD motif